MLSKLQGKEKEGGRNNGGKGSEEGKQASGSGELLNLTWNSRRAHSTWGYFRQGCEEVRVKWVQPEAKRPEEPDQSIDYNKIKVSAITVLTPKDTSSKIWLLTRQKG